MKEKGFTNGNIRLNTSRGMINGLTNGNGNPENKKSGGMANSPKKRAGTWIVVGVVLLLVFGAFAISVNSFKKIDWNTITKYEDFDTGVVKSSVNISKFAFHISGQTFGFYIKFDGNFIKTGEYQNLAFIFIDNDSNPNTGYNAGYLGADYMVRIAGDNGTVTAAFMKYSPGSAKDNYVWNWTSMGGVAVKEDDGNVITGVVNHKVNPNARLMVVAESKYSEDITPVVSIEKPALLVEETPNTGENTIKVTLRALYGEVKVSSVDMEVSEGVLLSGDNVKNQNIVNIGAVYPGKPKIFTINVDTSNVMNSNVTVSVRKVITNAPVTVWGTPFKKYVGTPTNIKIDGCFEDWDHLVGITHFNSDTYTVTNANITLSHYAIYTRGGDFFYADVAGNMLAGNIAPEMIKTIRGNEGPVPAPTKSKSPFDSATIIFTTNNGEKHTIQVFGVLGHVVKVLFDGKPTNNVSVGVGTNTLGGIKYGAIEIGINNANYTIRSYRVIMTDWNGATDVGVAHPAGGKAVEPTATPEFNTSYLAVLILLVPLMVRRKKN